MPFNNLYLDRDLEHPDITEIERNGYPRRYTEECNCEEPDSCAWCKGKFMNNEQIFRMSGEYICSCCFEDWLKELSLTDAADEMSIHYTTYA